MNLFLDLECTFQTDKDGRTDPSPYIKENYLVSAGFLAEPKDPFVWYQFFKHNNAPIDPMGWYNVQDALNATTLLIAHNAKFELAWLRACGFKYEGKIACTQIREYVLARGQKLPLNLKEICIRENLSNKKSDLADGYLRKSIGFEQMPWEVVLEYGIQDVISLKELYYNQLKRLEAAPHLWPTIHLMEEFCQVLVEIEESGIQIDVVKLDRLEAEYKERLQSLKIDLQKITEECMGATPVNLDSPEQLSQLIYSRKVIDKKAWKEIFNLGSEFRGAVLKPKRKTRYSTKDFVQLVKNHTEILYKTTAEHCNECAGKGKIRRVKKDGQNFSRDSVCRNCAGRGFSLNDLKQIAGLRCIPRGTQDASVGGFSTDKEVLDQLRETARGSGQEFLEKILEVNKIETYLNTFIAGIRRGLRGNNILHPSFMQTVTATGRLSSRNPNFQNQPRGGTFPIRKVVVSRFKGGKIIETDAKQLEFRVAGELSGSEMIFKDVLDGIDVHAATSKHTGYNRQDSKPHTFAPVYGATPNGKPEHIARYYNYFNDRYKLPEWHNRMATEIINSGGYYRLPSGKEFYYPDVKRYPSGGFSFSTQIANYPVQFMATGEMVPIVLIQLRNMFNEQTLQSKIILTVHDSIEIDAHPDEIDICCALLEAACDSLKEEYIRRFNYEVQMPIAWEVKIGNNWLEMKEV